MEQSERENLIKWLKQIAKLLENHTTMGSIMAKEKIERLIKRL